MGLAVGGIITITSAATPKYSSELIDFADVLGDATEICNKKNNRKIKISVLFGSHNNQIKIEVIETTKIKIKMRNYWYYYTCSKVIWKRNRNIITMDLIKLSISLAKISLLSHIRIM